MNFRDEEVQEVNGTSSTGTKAAKSMWKMAAKSARDVARRHSFMYQKTDGLFEHNVAEPPAQGLGTGLQTSPPRTPLLEDVLLDDAGVLGGSSTRRVMERRQSRRLDFADVSQTVLRLHGTLKTVSESMGDEDRVVEARLHCATLEQHAAAVSLALQDVVRESQRRLSALLHDDVSAIGASSAAQAAVSPLAASVSRRGSVEDMCLLSVASTLRRSTDVVAARHSAEERRDTEPCCLVPGGVPASPFTHCATLPSTQLEALFCASTDESAPISQTERAVYGQVPFAAHRSMSPLVCAGAFEWFSVFTRAKSNPLPLATSALTSFATRLALQCAAVLLGEIQKPSAASQPPPEWASLCVEGAVVTLWRRRKAAKLYHRCLSAVQNAVRRCCLPSVFHSVLAVCVCVDGWMFTVTVLPPLLPTAFGAPLSVSPGEAPALASAVSLLSVFLVQEEDMTAAVEVYPGADGAYIVFPGPHLCSALLSDRSGMKFAEVLLTQCYPTLATAEQRVISMLRSASKSLSLDSVDRSTFLRDVFHAAGARMRTLLSVRALILTALDVSAATALGAVGSASMDDHSGRFVLIQLTQLMWTECVARVLKCMICSRCFAASSMGGSALEATLRDGSATPLQAKEASLTGSTAAAATHVMKKFLSSQKFLQTSLAAALVKKYPLASADGILVDPRAANIADIVAFLKHRLGLRFDAKSREFVSATLSAPGSASGAASTVTPSAFVLDPTSATTRPASHFDQQSPPSVTEGSTFSRAVSDAQNGIGNIPAGHGDGCSVQGTSIPSIPGPLTCCDFLTVGEAIGSFVRYASAKLHPVMLSCGLCVSLYFCMVCKYYNMQGSHASVAAAAELPSLRRREMNAIVMLTIGVVSNALKARDEKPCGTPAGGRLMGCSRADEKVFLRLTCAEACDTSAALPTTAAFFSDCLWTLVNCEVHLASHLNMTGGISESSARSTLLTTSASGDNNGTTAKNVKLLSCWGRALLMHVHSAVSDRSFAYTGAATVSGLRAYLAHVSNIVNRDLEFIQDALQRGGQGRSECLVVCFAAVVAAHTLLRFPAGGAVTQDREGKRLADLLAEGGVMDAVAHFLCLCLLLSDDSSSERLPAVVVRNKKSELFPATAQTVLPSSLETKVVGCGLVGAHGLLRDSVIGLACRMPDDDPRSLLFLTAVPCAAPSMLPTCCCSVFLKAFRETVPPAACTLDTEWFRNQLLQLLQQSQRWLFHRVPDTIPETAAAGSEYQVVVRRLVLLKHADVSIKRTEVEHSKPAVSICAIRENVLKEPLTGCEIDDGTVVDNALLKQLGISGSFESPALDVRCRVCFPDLLTMRVARPRAESSVTLADDESHLGATHHNDGTQQLPELHIPLSLCKVVFTKVPIGVEVVVHRKGRVPKAPAKPKPNASETKHRRVAAVLDERLSAPVANQNWIVLPEEMKWLRIYARRLASEELERRDVLRRLESAAFFDILVVHNLLAAVHCASAPSSPGAGHATAARRRRDMERHIATSESSARDVIVLEEANARQSGFYAQSLLEVSSCNRALAKVDRLLSSERDSRMRLEREEFEDFVLSVVVQWELLCV